MALIVWLCVFLTTLKTRGVFCDEQMPHRNVIDRSPFDELYNCSQFTSCELCLSSSKNFCGFCSLLSNTSIGVCVRGDENDSDISCKSEILKAFPSIEFSTSDPSYWFHSCPNNCETDKDCYDNATCVNTTVGCVCNESMKGDGMRCESCKTECHSSHLIDEENADTFFVEFGNECVDGDRHCPYVGCLKTDDGYRCRCKDGYKYDGIACKAVCSEGCVHGTCIEKDVCKCFFGFVGKNCSLKCECNGHSDCEDEHNLKKCIECHNNTQGDYCERCKPFFVGSPLNGGRCTSCRMYCNGHTDICFSHEFFNSSHSKQTFKELKDLNVPEGPQNDAICLYCTDNTEGERCETCIPGYFKAPEFHDTCIQCQCHGHGDMCDPNTGESCNCGNNTENDRQCAGKHNKNSVTPCWQLQCSKCKEYFLGVPTHGHQCYRHMFLDRDYCFDAETQEECNRKPNALLWSRTVFFAVQPRYMNVDIRIVVDVSQGILDFYLSAKEDTFVVDVNKSNGVHNVWLDKNYNIEYDEKEKDLIILRKSYVSNDSFIPPQGPPLKVKHYMSNGLATYITVTNPNELLVVRSLDSRLVITIPQEVYDLRSTRFYIILRGIASETFGNLFFRQDQSRIDLFVFFSVFFSCFFLFLASCVVVWKVKQAFDMRRARRLHAAEMKHMASRPFASVLVYLDSRSESDDFEFALSALSHYVHGKKNKASTFRIKGSHSSLRDSPKYHGPYTDSDHYFVRPVAVESTSEGQAAVVTTLVILPGGSAAPVRLILASALVSLRGSHQILNQGNNPRIVGEVFRAAMKRRTTTSVI